MSEVIEQDYATFERNIFAHSSPKPLLKAVKRKHGGVKKPRVSKKRRCEPIYGPVDNEQGWVKLRCRQDDVLPDLVEEPKDRHQNRNPLIGNISDEDHSLEENRFQDVDESLSPSRQKSSDGEHLFLFSTHANHLNTQRQIQPKT